ncbi:unnamed protein product [Adineta ricciae]|uniref:Transmembrane protein n=1 Tax=Adineta ricciae TaxID=249248 RepID=A0A813XED2_ADIRI|nr:unnamed protein product [Adineta ricciae]
MRTLSDDKIRAGIDNRDLSSTSQNRHVSLANIATAFLSERKSSSRRTSSGRRKKRLTMRDKKGSGSRNASSFSTGLNDLFGQRLSSENMESNIAAIFMTNVSGTGANNKHRSTVNQHRRLSNTNDSPMFSQLVSLKENSIKSTGSVRIHLNVPGEQSRRSSFDFNLLSPAPTTVRLTKNRLHTTIPTSISTDLDGGRRNTRFSNVSSSYAQFLKQRDMDKLSQEDQRLLLSSSEWVEDVKDSDPYVSVLSRLGEAIQDSETLVEFVKKSYSIVANTYGATILLALLTVFQVILFFIGVKYLNDCPVQPNLPVYLLVAGAMGLVRALNLLWKQFRRRRLRKLEGVELDQEEETENNGSGFTDAVLNLFLFAWFIVGQFWTWSSFMPNFEFGLENPDKYCHKNVYIFALIHIGLVYVMFLGVILFLIALTCCATFPHLIVKAPR